MAHILQKVNEKLVEAGLQPINKDSLLFHYTPMKGAMCYTIIGTQMLNPELWENFNNGIVPRYISLTNACLLNSVTGMSLWLYSRPHMAALNHRDRGIYCVYFAGMFNLGSMLLWALFRTVAPESPALRTIIGGASAVGMVHMGKKHLEYLDSQIKSK